MTPMQSRQWNENTATRQLPIVSCPCGCGATVSYPMEVRFNHDNAP